VVQKLKASGVEGTFFTTGSDVADVNFTNFVFAGIDFCSGSDVSAIYF
jgi:hypothetical protein